MSYVVVKLYWIIPVLIIHHGSSGSFWGPFTLAFVIIGWIIGYFYRSRIDSVNNDINSVSNIEPVTHSRGVLPGSLKIIIFLLLSPFFLVLLWLFYAYSGLSLFFYEIGFSGFLFVVFLFVAIWVIILGIAHYWVHWKISPVFNRLFKFICYISICIVWFPLFLYLFPFVYKFFH